MIKALWTRAPWLPVNTACLGRGTLGQAVTDTLRKDSSLVRHTNLGLVLGGGKCGIGMAKATKAEDKTHAALPKPLPAAPGCPRGSQKLGGGGVRWQERHQQFPQTEHDGLRLLPESWGKPHTRHLVLEPGHSPATPTSSSWWGLEAPASSPGSSCSACPAALGGWRPRGRPRPGGAARRPWGSSSLASASSAAW